MRLIKKGIPEETEVTCEVCKSIYAYVKADVHILSANKNSKYEGVCCPVCNTAKATCVTIL